MTCPECNGRGRIGGVARGTIDDEEGEACPMCSGNHIFTVNRIRGWIKDEIEKCDEELNAYREKRSCKSENQLSAIKIRRKTLAEVMDEF
jgi:hypothetical protein